MTVHRIFNFSAGPGVLPLPVLEEAQRDLVALPGVGMSVLEISHRSKTFESIIQTAEANFRALAGLPDGYKVLFLQGGASLQFSMVPMNLMAPGGSADYLVTGVWSKKAVEEAKKVGTVNIIASAEEGKFKSVPKQDEIKPTQGASYVHMTSNNTIYGTQWHYVPEVGSAPLVCDASSDIFCRPTDFSRFALVYAGAQKNLAPAGVTVVVIREDLLARSRKELPTMLNYAVHAKESSLYNTPPCFTIYALGLTLKWLIANGGLSAMGERNARKAAKLYAEIDRTGYYRGNANKDSRSLMNVTYRLPSEELEGKFTKEATAAGLDGLKGHRNAGGIRASIYNAFPEEGVDALISFMQEFERKNG
jgi:phosphoserine aminotransferase